MACYVSLFRLLLSKITNTKARFLPKRDNQFITFQSSYLMTTTNKKLTRRERFSYWLKDKTPYFMVSTLILAIFLLLFFNRIVVSVESGEAGVLYKRFSTGTVTDYVYPESIHFVWPWNTLYIYNVRIQTVRHEMHVLTNKGLPITLYLAIRFRPEYEMLGMLHKNVGPDYVDTIIIPQIESVLRKNIGQLNPEDVYTNKEGILTKIMRLAMEETGRKYVTVDDIIIRRMTLPKIIEEAIELKLVEEQTYRTYDYKIQVAEEEAKRKKVEAIGIRDYQSTIAETLSADILTWQGIQATLALSESDNSKVVVIGASENGLPIILGGK